MLSTKYVRDNLKEIETSLKKRKSDYPLSELLELDEDNREVQKKIQELRAKRNKGSLEISEARKSNKEVSEGKIEELAKVKGEIEKLEAKIAKDETRIKELLWNMPNVLHESVPYGKDDADNVVVKTHGTAKHKKGPSHDEVLRNLDLVDLEQAAKVSGARFYYLKGDLVLLEQALIRFAIDELVKKGFTLISPPLMLKKEYYRGVVALGDFEETVYKVSETEESGGRKELEHMDEEMLLIATSEHPIATLDADKIFSARDLPKRYLGVSLCFRREAGSHGKDTKGIFRVHQFYKVEQFAITRQDDSWKMFDELMKNAETLYQKLGLPYRVVDICTGDIGSVAAKKQDIEVYMPSQDKYREVVSCSNCTDWQAARLDIRYDEGERRYVHTLNSTAIATTRTMVAIVENYLNEKGKITVPEVLVPYMNGKKTIG